MSNLRLTLTTSLKDQLVGPLTRALDEATKKITKAAGDVGILGQSGEQATQKMGNLAGKVDALGRASGAGKLKTDLGGVGQAADDAARKTGKLGDLLGKLPNLARGAAGALAGVVGGMTALKMVLAAPLQRAADYELELARVSNIAYDDRKTVAGRQAGQREMDQAVRTATVQGVTREDALTGLKTMIALGADRKDAMSLLPTIAQFSVAGEAAMPDVANIAFKAQQLYGIKPSEMKDVLQDALTTGKLGQFEFNDMAKWLPQQMAMSKGMLGMKGRDDFSTLLVANQFASKGAGNNAEAGNNLVNFLSKINSDSTSNEAKKLNIDLAGSLAAAREKGVGPVDAFLNLIEKITAADPEYQKIQKRLQESKASGDKNGEAETLAAMRDLMMGKSVGQLMPDREALQGLMAILNDRAGFDKMRSDLRESKGGVDIDQATLLATAAMKNQRGDNAEKNREFDAMQGIGNKLGDLTVKFAKLSEEYPNAAAGVQLLKAAALAAAGALAGLGLMNLATSGGVGKVVGQVGGALAGGTVGGALAGGALASGAAVAAGASALAAAVGYGAGTLLYKGALEGNAGGDAIGAGVARLLAFFGNDEAKASVALMEKYDAQMASEQAARQAQAEEIAQQQAQQMLAAMSPVIARMESLASRPVMVTLDGQVLADSLNNTNSRTARRN